MRYDCNGLQAPSGQATNLYRQEVLKEEIPCALRPSQNPPPPRRLQCRQTHPAQGSAMVRCTHMGRQGGAIINNKTGGGGQGATGSHSSDQTTHKCFRKPLLDICARNACECHQAVAALTASCSCLPAAYLYIGTCGREVVIPGTHPTRKQKDPR